eukprot:TRINITY_DN17676_c0_g1_i1.p1 TRINITY_DN17676_c0_g1~~TRINITY_DN17676_c0_g1_i1.p1  ORF type:complete len:106 (-),score=1.51 TRINITY_DN17676_c0_g1_i1:250-567(-)
MAASLLLGKCNQKSQLSDPRHWLNSEKICCHCCPVDPVAHPIKRQSAFSPSTDTQSMVWGRLFTKFETVIHLALACTYFALAVQILLFEISPAQLTSRHELATIV